MPRAARRQSESDVYHVMARGVNQSIIFEDDVDCERFLSTLRESFAKYDVELYCWCLMGNHFHLLVHTPMAVLGNAMKSLLARYAIYFNARHGRSGHLFQDRFGTEPVETDEYFMTVVRYIHQNPVKAGLSSSCEYTWSSYSEFLSPDGTSTTEHVLEIFGGVRPFIEFHSTESDDRVLDVRPLRRRIGDTQVVEFANREFGPDALSSVAGMPREERDTALRRLKQEGASVRQIQRLTGVGKRVIERA